MGNIFRVNFYEWLLICEFCESFPFKTHTLYSSYIAVAVTLVTKSCSYWTEVAAVVLDNCITTNKSKDISENDKEYCIRYNYEYLEDYVEENYMTEHIMDDYELG